ncbi:hypothetical protein RQP46_007407 [Phenoliferia psychrophenolica]
MKPSTAVPSIEPSLEHCDTEVVKAHAQAESPEAATPAETETETTNAVESAVDTETERENLLINDIATALKSLSIKLEDKPQQKSTTALPALDASAPPPAAVLTVKSSSPPASPVSPGITIFGRRISIFRPRRSLTSPQLSGHGDYETYGVPQQASNYVDNSAAQQAAPGNYLEIYGTSPTTSRYSPHHDPSRASSYYAHPTVYQSSPIASGLSQFETGYTSDPSSPPIAAMGLLTIRSSSTPSGSASQRYVNPRHAANATLDAVFRADFDYTSSTPARMEMKDHFLWDAAASKYRCKYCHPGSRGGNYKVAGEFQCSNVINRAHAHIQTHHPRVK